MAGGFMARKYAIGVSLFTREHPPFRGDTHAAERALKAAYIDATGIVPQDEMRDGARDQFTYRGRNERGRRILDAAKQN